MEQIQSLCKDCPRGAVDSSTVPSVKATEKLIESALASENGSERDNSSFLLFHSPQAQGTIIIVMIPVTCYTHNDFCIAALSCLLFEWTPDASVFLSVGQREKVPVQLLNDLSCQTPKPLEYV